MSAVPLPHRHKDIDLTDADWEFVYYVHSRLPEEAELIRQLIRERHLDRGVGRPSFRTWRRAEFGALLWLIDCDEQRAAAEAGLS